MRAGGPVGVTKDGRLIGQVTKDSVIKELVQNC